MNARYYLSTLLAVFLCGAAIAGEPSGAAPKSDGAAPGKDSRIEEIVVQARVPESVMPVAVRPEIPAPRFVPPPLSIVKPPKAPSTAAEIQDRPDRLADAGTKPKL